MAECECGGRVSCPRQSQCDNCLVSDRLIQLKTNSRDWRRRLRLAALLIYGGKCQCCNEDREAFLQIDHVNGDGANHRRNMGSSAKVYKWLKDHSYPSGFQVLCANCNMAKERAEGCPHKSTVAVQTPHQLAKELQLEIDPDTRQWKLPSSRHRIRRNNPEEYKNLVLQTAAELPNATAGEFDAAIKGKLGGTARNQHLGWIRRKAVDSGWLIEKRSGIKKHYSLGTNTSP